MIYAIIALIGAGVVLLIITVDAIYRVGENNREDI